MIKITESASAIAAVKCTQVKGLADKSAYTYGTADLVLWTIVESDIMIIASCIPTLHPVLELVVSKCKLPSCSGSRNKEKGSQQLNDFSHSRSHSKITKTQRKADLPIIGDESQESILRDDESVGHPLGAIRRNGNLTVEYESCGRGEQEASSPASESW
ncbi:hypothetical protein BDW75DRAFT_237943 [Aspergillus navahoensis]